MNSIQNILYLAQFDKDEVVSFQAMECQTYFINIHEKLKSSNEISIHSSLKVHTSTFF